MSSVISIWASFDWIKQSEIADEQELFETSYIRLQMVLK